MYNASISIAVVAVVSFFLCDLVRLHSAVEWHTHRVCARMALQSDICQCGCLLSPVRFEILVMWMCGVYDSVAGRFILPVMKARKVAAYFGGHDHFLQYARLAIPAPSPIDVPHAFLDLFLREHVP